MTQHKIKCNNCQSNNYKCLIRVKNNKSAEFIAPFSDVVICKDCGLVFLNPQHDEKDYLKYYQKFNRPGPIKKQFRKLSKIKSTKKNWLNFY